jgi:small-conductance mechanosensitive channel
LRVARSRFTNKILLFLFASAVALLATYLFWSFSPEVKRLLEHRMGATPSPSADTIVNIVKLLLVGIIGYLFVRALNALFFALAFRLKRIDAPTLIRNIFTIVAFTILFLIAFTFLFPEVNLGALFTTSAIFGVILGLALQDTLGNFFAGISLQADRPFQVGDVITVGAQRHTGVVEEISWRAIKIRTFTNHVVLIHV